MGERGPWRRPDLEPGPLLELNDALHGLREQAGSPGSRQLARAVSARGGKASHTRVYDVFVQPRLPERELLLHLVATGLLPMPAVTAKLQGLCTAAWRSLPTWLEHDESGPRPGEPGGGC